TPPDLGSRVPRQYGGANLEGYEAHGGWIASAVDLVRFATAFNDPAKSPLLSKESIELMWSAPPGSVGHDDKGRPRKAYYGCGWKVANEGEHSVPTIQHGGLIMGGETTLVRRCDGVTWCVLFNTNHPKGEPLL